MNIKLNYNESCLIVNALNTYLVEMDKQGLSKSGQEAIKETIKKYEILEKDILKIKKEV